MHTIIDENKLAMKGLDFDIEERNLIGNQE